MDTESTTAPEKESQTLRDKNDIKNGVVHGRSNKNAKTSQITSHLNKNSKLLLFLLIPNNVKVLFPCMNR